MKLQSRLVTLCATVACALAISGVLWANGQEFFTDDDDADLFYFGHIKDMDGKVLDNVRITVTAKSIGMRFPVRNDMPGHFRTADIGRAVKGLGKPIVTSQLEIAVTKPGYRQVMPGTLAVPDVDSGGVEIEFRMVPDGTAAGRK